MSDLAVVLLDEIDVFRRRLRFTTQTTTVAMEAIEALTHLIPPEHGEEAAQILGDALGALQLLRDIDTRLSEG